MNHTEVLDTILANACGRLSDEELKAAEGWQQYHIELHCQEFIVVARHLGNLKYEVRELRK